MAKLKDSASFNRGDAAVFIALGDAFLALAELAGEPAAELALLQRALREGFSAALHIDRNQADAVVGTAEAELQLGKRKPFKTSLGGITVQLVHLWLVSRTKVFVSVRRRVCLDVQEIVFAVGHVKEARRDLEGELVFLASCQPCPVQAVSPKLDNVIQPNERFVRPLHAQEQKALSTQAQQEQHHFASCAVATGAEAEEHFYRSFQAYMAALQKPQTLRAFKDRCEVRFNCACAAALSGNHQVAAPHPKMADLIA